MNTLNPVTLENWDLHLLTQHLGVKPKDFGLLIEAYRRKNLIHSQPKNYTDWLGLGMPSIYKSKFFKAHGQETPRVGNWYVLTKDGIELLKTIEEYIPIPNNDNIRNKLNLKLYDYRPY